MSSRRCAKAAAECWAIACDGVLCCNGTCVAEAGQCADVTRDCLTTGLSCKYRGPVSECYAGCQGLESDCPVGNSTCEAAPLFSSCNWVAERPIAIQRQYHQLDIVSEYAESWGSLEIATLDSGDAVFVMPGEAQAKKVSRLVSPVLQIYLASGKTTDLLLDINISSQVIQVTNLDKSLSDMCLSFWHESKKQWRCVKDELIAKTQDNITLVAGRSPHLTNFALLLLGNSGSQSGWYGWATLGCVCGAIVFVLFCIISPPTRYLLVGTSEEGSRVEKLRKFQRNSLHTKSGQNIENAEDLEAATNEVARREAAAPPVAESLVTSKDW